MKFFFILHFENDAGYTTQLASHIPTGNLYSRYSYQGGAFSAWRRIDVNRFSDGTLNEVVDTARKLNAAMTINFTGDVEGSVSFDGSKDVTASLSSSGGGFLDYENAVTVSNDFQVTTYTVPEKGGAIWGNYSSYDTTGILINGKEVPRISMTYGGSSSTRYNSVYFLPAIKGGSEISWANGYNPQNSFSFTFIPFL